MLNMDKPIVPVPPHVFKLAQEIGFKDSHFDIVEDKPVMPGDTKHCPDCLAYYTGHHTCPPWLKAIVTKNKYKE
jgi:hypothetical protein